tara:strand:+ start:428 stop:832 length:405 start_codon:yes stop_codon:yes gene_type:complete
MKFSQFAAKHNDKYLVAFDGGIDDNDNEWLDVLAYDSEEDANSDEEEGTNKRAIARADVIDDREELKLDFIQRALRAAINGIEAKKVVYFRDKLIDACAMANAEFEVFEAALNAYDSAIASMIPDCRNRSKFGA